MIYWEDVVLDVPRESVQSYVLTADNIKGFASEWDPFPPHVDEAAAARSPIGQLFAAGVHLLSITIRLSHTLVSEETATIAGRGWDKLRFRQPGVVGDELRVRLRQPLRGVARGQTMACYRPDPAGDEVIASATIAGTGV